MLFSIVHEGHDLRFVRCIWASLNMIMLFYDNFFKCYKHWHVCRGSHGSHQWVQCSTKGRIGFGFSSQACWSRLKSKHKQRVGNVVFKNDLQHGCLPPTYEGFLFSQNLAPSLVYPGIRWKIDVLNFSTNFCHNLWTRTRAKIQVQVCQDIRSWLLAVVYIMQYYIAWGFGFCQEKSKEEDHVWGNSVEAQEQ